MLARLRNWWTKLMSSLWFVPGLMALGALVLAGVVQTIDSRTSLDPENVPLLFRGTAEGASAALSAVAGSMIGVTGVVFSITVVALSLASSQLGPRLLRSFMRDTSNQIVLGTFIGTFAFCLVGLQAVNRELGPDGVPRITVTVAFALALMSLGVLIYFIHHITLAMQADTVIAKVTSELHESIERLFPSRLGTPATDRRAPPPPATIPALVEMPRSGYLQAIDEDRLLSLTREHDLLIHLSCRPGQFLRTGGVAARVWPAERADDVVVTALTRTFIMGPRRTAEQDVEFLVDQLAEIACRALSPGTNDPFTAMACIDRLGDVLGVLVVKEFPAAPREDSDGTLRVVARPVDFEGLLDAAFDQIRQYGRTSVSVTIRLLEALRAIAEECPPGDPRRALIIERAHRVHRTSLQEEREESDRADIDARYQAVLRSSHKNGKRPAARKL